MAIKQSVTSSRFPYLLIHLHLQQGKVRLETDFEALLDTGFDGDVVIPKEMIGENFKPAGYLSWKLADSSEVLAAAYLGQAKIGSLDSVPVVIIALGDEPMIGRNFTNRYKIILDRGKKLVIEP